MKIEEFKANIEATIDLLYAKRMERKGPGEEYLTYFDLLAITRGVRNVFQNRVRFVPNQVQVACHLSEAVLAPSTSAKLDCIKAAITIGGGASGIAMVIAGIGMALGWGAGVVATVVAFFTGTSLLGPIAWIASGVTLAVITAFFALSGSESVQSERAINALKNGVSNAVDAIWDELGPKLSREEAGNNHSDDAAEPVIVSRV